MKMKTSNSHFSSLLCACSIFYGIGHLPAQELSAAKNEGAGSWFPSTVAEQEIIFYSYPNVLKTLEGAFQRVQDFPKEKLPSGNNMSSRMEVLVRFLAAYKALLRVSASYSDAQLNQEGESVVIESANAKSVKQLLTQVDVFLKEKKITADEIDRIIASAGSENPNIGIEI